MAADKAFEKLCPADSIAPYFPALHGVQVEDAKPLDCPASHAVQMLCLAEEEYPAGQIWQLVAAKEVSLLFCAANVPSSHDVQNDDSRVLYVPKLHAWQCVFPLGA